MVPEENGASDAKNTIIPETTIFMDFLATCRSTDTFIMIEFFGLCPDIKKGYRKTQLKMITNRLIRNIPFETGI